MVRLRTGLSQSSRGCSRARPANRNISETCVPHAKEVKAMVMTIFSTAHQGLSVRLSVGVRVNVNAVVVRVMVRTPRARLLRQA